MEKVGGSSPSAPTILLFGLLLAWPGRGEAQTGRSFENPNVGHAQATYRDDVTGLTLTKPDNWSWMSCQTRHGAAFLKYDFHGDGPPPGEKTGIVIGLQRCLGERRPDPSFARIDVERMTLNPDATLDDVAQWLGGPIVPAEGNVAALSPITLGGKRWMATGWIDQPTTTSGGAGKDVAEAPVERLLLRRVDDELLVIMAMVEKEHLADAEPEIAQILNTISLPGPDDP